jgi:PhoH-like ATPase
MNNDAQKTTRLNRIFILDTNVLIHDPNAIYNFKSVIVGIPFIVLEELDHFKRESDERGRNAREIIRQLDILRNQGCLQSGVNLNHDTKDSIFKVFPNPATRKLDILDNIKIIKDNLILETTQNLVKEGNKVTIVTKDINLRVKADVLGIEAEDYTKGKVDYDDFYKGWTKISTPAQELKIITPEKVSSLVHQEELNPNQYIVVTSNNNEENNRLFRYSGNNLFKEVKNIQIMNNFEAKNIQQLMTLDLLMDKSIQLITLVGPAGTGKTFLSLLVGLYQVMNLKVFKKVLVTRPVIALGADIGYLPGDIQEKLHFWMQPVHDNLEFISSQLAHKEGIFLNVKQTTKKTKKKFQVKKEKFYASAENNIVEQLQKKGFLSLEAITYMRGRSIPNQFMLIDEAQNLTPHEVKTLVSRAGEGTKVILSGDPYQIDSPYLDFSSNGLTVTTEKMKHKTLFGTVFLETSERSELAKIAAEIL